MKVFTKRDIKIINLRYLKKVENCKLKSNNIFLKLYINIDKKIYNVDNVDIQKVLSKILFYTS